MVGEEASVSVSYIKGLAQKYRKQSLDHAGWFEKGPRCSIVHQRQAFPNYDQRAGIDLWRLVRATDEDQEDERKRVVSRELIERQDRPCIQRTSSSRFLCRRPP